MGRPNTVYRGKRKYRWVITVILFVVAALLLAGAWLFNYMQKFIVYDKDSLHLELPFMGQTDAQPDDDGEETVYVPTVDAEIVVDQPAFDDVDIGAGEDISTLQARYIPADSMSSMNLSYYGSALASSGQNAMVLQLKTTSGYFSYLSSVPMAASYGVNGVEDISEAVAQLKEQGVYLVAEIAALQDDSLAFRNNPLALKNSSGSVVTEYGASWLDPYNKDVRTYITDIMAELADMGFDEIVLTGMTHPKSDDVVFSQEMTQTPDLAGSVSTFALRMSENARELGMKCSVLCDADALRQGTSADIGQDLELFARIFDRIYVSTDMNYLTMDVSALEAALGSGSGARIVPIVSGYTPGTESWASQ